MNFNMSIAKKAQQSLLNKKLNLQKWIRKKKLEIKQN
jgi:hypothetical protein